MTKNVVAEWEAGYRHKEGGGGAPVLAPPTGLRATTGRAQVTLDWEPVEGACGYLVHRGEPGGELSPLDHRGMDVLAVPHPPYADTTGEPGRTYAYAVATLTDVDTVGPVSGPITAASEAVEGPVPTVAIAVDAGAPGAELPRPWRPMIGSEHLSYLECTDTSGGRPIGTELADALRQAATTLGVQGVRAHGILCDDLGVYTEVDGEPVHDFAGVDRVYDTVLELGMVPVVELSFTPRALARDAATVFSYGASASPPKDWDRWADLVRDLVAHLAERYGIDAIVRDWSFEVWNEANLGVFWSGTEAEYWRLYDVTAAAVKDVDPRIRVGGPSTAAAGWVTEQLDHIAGSGAPLDFLTTHTYGSPPLDFRPALERAGRGGTPIWWTEWGVSPQHFNPVNDAVFSAAFLARGMRSAAGRIESLAYWVVSDHFEELGRPPALLHGGFGLISVGGLRKPRFWALAMLERLGQAELPVTATGDGADSLVESWAGADPDGRVAVAVWNGTLDQTKIGGAPALDRSVELAVSGVTPGRYRLSHHRLDRAHSDITATWFAMGGVTGGPHAGAAEGALWPSDEQWEQLHAADELAELEPAVEITVGGGPVALTFTLPMPGMSLIELTPLG